MKPSVAPRRSHGDWRPQQGRGETRVRSTALLHDGRHESRGWGETHQAPAAVVPRGVLDAQDLRGLTRRERNIEVIERMGEAVAERLDEGFLARPTIKEAEQLVARGEGLVGL